MNVKTRARRYAYILSILFAQQNFAGGKLSKVTRGARHLSLAVRLNNPTELDRALKLSEPLALAAGIRNVLAQRQAGVVAYQFELNQAFWAYYTRKDLPRAKAVGLAEQRKPVDFEFDRQPHALIAGSTGSGKSETIKSILLSLIASYTPDRLELVLVDLHGDYTDFDNEAHLALPVAAEQEAIQQALLYVNQQLAHRKREGIKDGKVIVLVIDEADKVLSDNSRLEIVKSVSTEGRKFNIHLIIGTQKPSHKALPNVLDNLNNRFVGLVSDAKISANLTGRSGLQAHLLTGSGDFIHINGMDVNRFQVAMATGQDFNRLERTELQPVVVEPDLIELPAELPKKAAGRPPNEVEPELAAFYYYHGPGNISIAQAKDLLGLSRDNHNLHKGFVERFNSALLQLKGGRG